MANYYSTTKSNDFRVTDIEKFRQLCDDLYTAEDEVFVDVNEETGECSICCYGSLDYADAAQGIDQFYYNLSEIIAPDDKAIFIEVGNEKLRYVGAFATTVTTGHVDFMDLEALAEQKADEMIAERRNNQIER